MSRIVTLIALLAILVVKSVFAAAEVTNIPLTPDVPSAMIYMNRSDDRQYSALGTYFVVNTTSSPSVGAFSFIVSRDTTRARLIWWWSTTQPRPTQHDHEGSAVLFEQQNNAYVFAGLGSVPRT